jgi:hypothetical protein
METTNEYVTEDGLLVEEFPGGRTTKCITEECIRQRHGEDHCSCEECVSKRLSKNDDRVKDSYTFEELREALPEQLWSELTEHLSDPDGSASDEGEMDMAKSFYVRDPPGQVGAAAAALEASTEPVEKSGTPFDAPDGFDGSVEDVDRSGALGLFYEGVEDDG